MTYKPEDLEWVIVTRPGKQPFKARAAEVDDTPWVGMVSESHGMSIEHIDTLSPLPGSIAENNAKIIERFESMPHHPGRFPLS